MREFFKIESNFITLLQKYPLFAAKYNSDMLKQEELPTGGLISKILELPLIESQVEVTLLIKLQKMILVIEKILQNIETTLVTQYTLKESFKELAQIVCETLMYELIFKIMFFEVDCLTTLNDYHAASKLLKPMAIIADLFWDYKVQKKCYLNLGNCSKYLGDYKQAKVYYEKFLHMSWFSKDSISELKAYDLIGMSYYYQNDLEMAQKYHQRSLSPDSALEDKEFNFLVESKLKDEESRRTRLLTLRPVFFRYEIMKDFMTYEGDLEPMLKIRDLHQYLSSPFSVENLSLKTSNKNTDLELQTHGKSQHKGLQVRIKPILSSSSYFADFSPEGYTNAMFHSNPAIYQLIQEGKFKLDNGNIKGVNLYDKTYSSVEDPKMLSHMSPNNSKATFMMASKDPAEICLEFLKRNSKERVQTMVVNLKEQLLEYVAWICRPRGELQEESVSVPYVSLISKGKNSQSTSAIGVKKAQFVKLATGQPNKLKLPGIVGGGAKSVRIREEASPGGFTKSVTKLEQSVGGKKSGRTEKTRLTTDTSQIGYSDSYSLRAGVSKGAAMFVSPKLLRVGSKKPPSELTQLSGGGRRQRGEVSLPLLLSPLGTSPVAKLPNKS